MVLVSTGQHLPPLLLTVAAPTQREPIDDAVSRRLAVQPLGLGELRLGGLELREHGLVRRALPLEKRALSRSNERDMTLPTLPDFKNFIAST